MTKRSKGKSGKEKIHDKLEKETFCSSKINLVALPSIVRLQLPSLERQVSIPIDSQSKITQSASAELNGQFLFIKFRIMNISCTPMAQYNCFIRAIFVHARKKIHNFSYQNKLLPELSA